MIRFDNNFTTPEQSKRLLELGVPADSADCYYTQEEIEGSMYWFDLHIKREYQPHTSLHASTIWDEILPSWSAGQLIKIIGICASIDSFEVKCRNSIDDIISVIEHDITYEHELDFSKLEEGI